MTILRMLLSVAIFIAAILALVGLFLNGFSWLYVAVVVIGFLLAAWVWPSRRESGRHRKDHGFIDGLELLIEFPAEILLLPFRLIVSIAKLGGVKNQRVLV